MSRISSALPLPNGQRVEKSPFAQGRGAPPPFSVYLHAGQVFASSQGDVVLTILGSCVSVCMWEPDFGVGGMNHFLLPHGPRSGPSSARFGNGAVLTLIERLQALGCPKGKLRAKVFGGARVLGSPQGQGGDLGEKNANKALEILEAEGITVVSQDVGGRRGRKLIFAVASGDAWVKKI